MTLVYDTATNTATVFFLGGDRTRVRSVELRAGKSLVWLDADDALVAVEILDVDPDSNPAGLFHEAGEAVRHCRWVGVRS